MLLALDISVAATGWAWGGAEGPTRFGTKDIRRNSDVPKDFGPRYVRYMDWFDDIIRLLRPRAIFMEAPLAASAQTHSDTARQIFGLVAITEAMAVKHEIGIVSEAHVGSVRAFFAGNGRADKAEIIAECHRRGWKVQSDGEGDAAAVWAYGRASPTTKRLWA